MRKTIGAFLRVAAALTLFGATNVLAGQLKNLNNTSTLAPNGLVRAVSSPQNTGTSMEMEAFEFLTTPEAATWTCRILGNGAGAPLNMRLVGLNGTIINSCVAPAGGVCNTPAVGLVGGHRFICLVATQNGAPVAPLGTYTMAVHRGTVPPAALVDPEFAASGVLVSQP